MVVWFDAHGDLNTPENTTTGYLGGLVLGAAMGWWDSGLGSGLTPDRVVLGGSRDLDAEEQTLVDEGIIKLAVGASLLDALDEHVGAHPVYFHLDCDVLQPGTVPTEYVVPGGISLDDLAAVSARLSRNEIVGIEVAEFEAPADPADHGRYVEPLVDALTPMLAAAHRKA
jgi:arginase family enzyme